MDDKLAVLCRDMLDSLRVTLRADLLTCYFFNPYSRLWWLFHKSGNLNCPSQMEGPITSQALVKARMYGLASDEKPYRSNSAQSDVSFSVLGAKSAPELTSQIGGVVPFAIRESVRSVVRVRFPAIGNVSPSSPIAVVFLNYRSNGCHARHGTFDISQQDTEEIHRWAVGIGRTLLELANQPRIDEYNAWRLRSLQVHVANRMGEITGRRAHAEAQEICNLIVEGARELIVPCAGRHTLCTLSTIDSRNQVRTEAYWPRVVGSRAKRRMHGIVEYVARTGQMFSISSVAEYKRALRRFNRRDIPRSSVFPDYVQCHPKTRCELACPIMLGKKTLGVLNLEADTPHAYDDAHVLLLHQFATSAGLVVRDAILWRDMNTAANQSSQVLAAENDEAVFRSVLDAARDLGFQPVIYDNQKIAKSWYPVRSRPDTPRKNGFTNWVLRHKQALVLSDFRVDQHGRHVTCTARRGDMSRGNRLLSAWEDVARSRDLPAEATYRYLAERVIKREIRTDFAIPLFEEDEVRAVLWVETPKEFAAMLTNEAWCLSLICNNASTALTIRSRKRNMMRFFGHDATTPLVAVRDAYLPALRDAVEKQMLERARTVLTDLDDIVGFMLAEFDGYASFHGSDIRWCHQVVNIRSLIDTVLKVVKPQSPSRTIYRIRVLPNDRATCLVPLSCLAVILYNLLNNAAKALAATAANRRPIIRVRVDVDNRKLRLSVSDNGPGVPKALRKRVFSEGVTTDKSRLGIGLAIVKAFVSAVQGHVRLKSRLGRASTFLVEIPTNVRGDTTLCKGERAT